MSFDLAFSAMPPPLSLPPLLRPRLSFSSTPRRPRLFCSSPNTPPTTPPAVASATPATTVTTTPFTTINASPITTPHPLPDTALRAECRVYNLRGPCINYHAAWDMQHALANELKADADATDALVLLEHEPVYTLGTASALENVLFDARELRRDGAAAASTTERDGQKSDAPLLVRTERGGEVTYHGPGQLVMYPIVNLRRHRLDLHWYLRALEDVAIGVMGEVYGLHAGRKEGLTGVWVGDEKVAAIGLKVSKWVTMHGVAINIRCDLAPFKRIVPCGIHGHGVTSVRDLLGRDVCMDEARAGMLRAFDNVFGPFDFESCNYKLAQNRL